METQLKKRLISGGGLGLLVLFTLFCILALVIVIWDIFSKGLPVINGEFIVGYPKEGMTKGGIFPAIMGTVLVTGITALFAIPVGIAGGVYLNEYARQTSFTRLIRASIRNLAGVPSIVYGLFGLALFVQAFRMGTSLLASGLTLGLMSLPYIITATEEALKTVPKGIREGSLALGATQWETLARVILPVATPGITTGVILALGQSRWGDRTDSIHRCLFLFTLLTRFYFG